MTKKSWLGLIFSCLFLVMVGCGSDDAIPRTFEMRNIGKEDIVLKNVVIDGQTLLNRDFTLVQVAQDAPVSAKDFSVNFNSAGPNIDMQILLYDTAQGNEVKVTHTFEIKGHTVVTAWYASGQIFMFAK